MEALFDHIQIVIIPTFQNDYKPSYWEYGIHIQIELLKWYGLTNIVIYDSNINIFNNIAFFYESKKEYFLILEPKKYVDANFKELCIQCLANKDRKIIEIQLRGVEKLYWISNKSCIEKILHNFNDKKSVYSYNSNPNKVLDLDDTLIDKYFKQYVECRPAIFLDRDGVINDLVFNDDVEKFDSPLKKDEVRIIPKVVEAISILKNMGYRLILISNQPAAAKGKISLSNLYDVNNYIMKLICHNEIMFDEVMLCEHYAQGLENNDYWGIKRECNCRKPKVGLILKILEKYNIDLLRSFVIGDSYTDILMGKTLGITSVLVGEMKCEVCKHFNDETHPNYIVKSLFDFADKIHEMQNVRYD